MAELVFLKLGGSLITDKTGVEALRPGVLARVAGEVQEVLSQRPDLHLLLGHGSGSFGHVPAAKYDTRRGVRSPQEWRGFAEVSDAAARLNAIVRETFLQAGVPVLTVQPSASVRCHDGTIRALETGPIRAALQARLIPLIYGDVAFDDERGGTIVSTEELLAYLVPELHPRWLLLAGQTGGVYDGQGKIIPSIGPEGFRQIRGALGGSGGTDVTGGMASKVRTMLDLVQDHQGLSIRIFSGLQPGCLRDVLLHPQDDAGTIIRP